MVLNNLNSLKGFLLKLKPKITAAQDYQALVYALGLVNKRLYVRESSSRNVVIIGPTQAGKSTLVNLLLGLKVAKVSALAAFTRKANGFTTNDDMQSIKTTLDKFFAISPVNSSQKPTWLLRQIQNSEYKNTTVWDTPDFDSVDAPGYKESSLMLCALADLVVLVLSKEKYADLAVWQILKLSKFSKRPLLVFVNKIDPKDSEQILNILHNKFKQENIENIGIFALPYIKEDVALKLAEHKSVIKAKNLIKTKLAESQAPQGDIKAYLKYYWTDWTRSLTSELQAKNTWHKLISSEIESAKDAYQRDYLQSAIYGDTRQKTMLKLLELLEIPQLAATLGTIRSIITWPFRTLAKNFGLQTTTGKNSPGNEQTVLLEIQESINIKLLRKVGEHSADDKTGWWRELWQVLKTQEATLQAQSARRIKQYQIDFAPQIHEVAQKIYQRLEKEPATLNSLRAARASVDAAAVLFAIKTAGIGLNDLVLTPAMLAFTSMITEGAVGHYLRREEEKLKTRQLMSVFELLDKFGQDLANLPAAVSQDKIFAIDAKEFKTITDSIHKL